MGLFDNLFKRTSTSSSTLKEIPENWRVSTGENNKKPMVVKKNTGCDSLAGNKRYTTLCGISFKLLAPNAHGLPDNENEPELDVMEDDILEFFQADFTAIVPIIITTSGFREFVLYTKNLANFNTILEKLKQKYPQYELTSYHKPDPDWNVYKTF